MKKLFAITTIILLTINSKGIEKMKAFDIPPSGKPELLLGDIKFKAPTAMAFDSKNRPYLINNRNPDSIGLLRTVRDGKWITTSFRSMLDQEKLSKKRNFHANGELVIDDADGLYTILMGKLIYSPDLGKTFKTYPCSGSLELRVGPNKLEFPPAICQTKTKYVDREKKRQPKMAWWARRGNLSILLPEKTEDGLELGDPILITDKCLAAGSGGHSGGTSFAVTIGDKIHIVYAEAPEDVREGGNPIHIATVDRKTRTVLAKKFLVTAPPRKTDVHTRPTITVDSKGYLHVLSGSHGQPFFYLKSLNPNDITGGWTKPAPMIGKQCYASIVCDKEDRLHSVFREWIPHPSLGYSYAEAEEGKWTKPVTLVHGANPKGKKEYGIFYHRLFIDRASNLYINFTFFEFKTGDKGIYPEVLIVSKDRGKTWQLASSETFLPNVDTEKNNSGGQ